MKIIALAFIKMYRLCISPMIGQTCRFYPSCSEYAQEAFKKHGFWKAFLLTFRRIAKCHPGHPGGVDEVP